MEDKISNYITGFRKWNGTQCPLVIGILEKWKQPIDKEIYISVIHSDLSKEFGTILPGPFLSKTKSLWFFSKCFKFIIYEKHEAKSSHK